VALLIINSFLLSSTLQSLFAILTFIFLSSLNFDSLSFSNEKKRKHAYSLLLLFLFYLTFFFFVSVRVLHSNESATVTANSRSSMMNYFATLFGQKIATTNPHS
jgi:phosphoglycerol transferase MdoB-like AlkP superfamily enzyme